MFKNPKKTKRFPEGTFIATPARIAAILQLCIAFTVLLSNIGLPFMGEAYQNRSQKIAYQSVIGGSDCETAKRTFEYFQSLPITTQKQILEGYHNLNSRQNKGFMEKAQASLSIILLHLPPFKMAWLCLSFIVPIMLLKKVPSGRMCSLLLPLVTLIHCIDGLYYGKTPELSPGDKLYPQEDYLVEHYMDSPISTNVLTQHSQLKEAWNRYLISEWAPQVESIDSDDLLEKGQFAFNLERLRAIQSTEVDLFAQFTEREPLPYYMIYLIWNTLFAIVIFRSIEPETIEFTNLSRNIN
ncbi:MAG: hypothetical protein VX777_01675 [Chlamydiota bacterium]|nr:hypothetical protein [Chlamydiota bacterium]